MVYVPPFHMYDYKIEPETERVTVKCNVCKAKAFKVFPSKVLAGRLHNKKIEEVENMIKHKKDNCKETAEYLEENQPVGC
ncbi:MAG: hypothetical protein V1838_02190 [Patescibacteria group bacterium]